MGFRRGGGQIDLLPLAYPGFSRNWVKGIVSLISSDAKMVMSDLQWYP